MLSLILLACTQDPTPPPTPQAELLEVLEPQLVPEPVEVLDAVPAERVSFLLSFGDEVSPFRLMTTTVLPGEPLRLSAQLTRHTATLGADTGTIVSTGPERWTWTAPQEPGLATLTVSDGDEQMQLNVFVTEPYAGQREFHGFEMGRYADRPPAGLIRVRPEHRALPVSPHLTLGDFVSDQGGDPVFVTLSPRLLVKLEMLIEAFDDAGLPAEDLEVLSGYRTPWWNAHIGNTTTRSRHLLGDAADIYLDSDGDGNLDDLDGDGQLDRDDAEILAAVVESLTYAPWYQPYIGGLGIYGPAPHRAGFIHVDVRGTRARW